MGHGRPITDPVDTLATDNVGVGRPSGVLQPVPVIAAVSGNRVKIRGPMPAKGGSFVRWNHQPTRFGTSFAQRRCCAVGLLLAVVALGCGESRRTTEQIRAGLDRIDVLLARREWQAARNEMKTTLEEINRLPYASPARAETSNRMNAQAQMLIAGEVEESRARLEKTHISVEDLWRTFNANEIRATRLYTGKEVSVRGEVGMVATNQFDKPYLTLQSKDADFSVQAIFSTGRAGSLFARVGSVGETVFVTCRYDGKSRSVIVLTGCSLNVPTAANGYLPTTDRNQRRETTKCADAPRECA